MEWHKLRLTARYSNTSINTRENKHGIKMNYLKHYIKLIRKAQQSTYECYSENHHVFPTSIFGKNNYTVKMSAREHYVAHALLEKIYIKRYGINNKNTHKMIHAFFMMNNAEGCGQNRYINSRLFEASKLRFSQRMSGENSPMYGKKRVFSEQHLENLRATYKKGKNNPTYGIPRNEVTLAKMRKSKHNGHGAAVSQGRMGIKFSQEHLKNLSESHKGQQAWNKGIPWDNTVRQKMSESQKNKDKSFMTEEYKKKISESVKLVWAERKANKLKEQTNGTE